MLRWCVLLTLLTVLAGCEMKPKGMTVVEKKTVKKSPWKPAAEVKKSNGSAQVDKTPPSKPIREFKSDFPERTFVEPNFGQSAASGFGSNSFGGTSSYVGGRDSAADALGHVLARVKESLQDHSVLVVWLLDNSRSGQDLLSQALPRIKSFHETEAPPDGKLKAALVTFSGAVAFPVDEPTPDAAALNAALDGLKVDDSGKEQPFTAVKQAAEKYGKLRSQTNEVYFCLITDEAGDDEAAVDEALRIPKAKLMPVYVVGLPAPMGRAYVPGNTSEGPKDYQPTPGGWIPVKVGPESRQSEMIALTSGTGGGGMGEYMDSGFGPYALERLAQATEGKFYAVRSLGRVGVDSGWPSSSATRFDPEVMKRYAPEYISEADYQAQLSGNRAKQALVNAAKLPPVSITAVFGDRTFGNAGGNEARLKQALDQAQRTAAKLEPLIEPLYQALKDGEGERDKLTSPRWQAEFDSAYGRVLAIKARIDGYNAMLALLKQGKTFANPSSSAWVLEEADKTEAGSAIANLCEKSRTYLERVVNEHKGTPWAQLAAQELQQPTGWKWIER